MFLMSFLVKGLAWSAGAYIGFLLLLLPPTLQRHLLYLHKVHWPLFAKFETPEKYGLAPFKTRNYKVSTPDGVRLGSWHILPHSWYRTNAESFPPKAAFSEYTFEDALAAKLTIITFHGNAATRAIGDRVRTYSALSTRLNCNVIAPDYRGFADSTGSPDERGLLLDARSVWDDTISKIQRGRARSGVTNDKTDAASSIVIMGHSLGTGVASALVQQLQNEGIKPRGLVLLAPFTSIPDLLATYRLLLVFPVLSPLRLIPGLQTFVSRFLRDRFNTRQALRDVQIPILIAHTLDDLNIPVSHSATLFDTLRSSVAVQVSHHAPWGRVSRAKLHTGEPLVWWEGQSGGHNGVIYDDGVLDLIADEMQM